ncbi:acyl-CoA (8-3)-desaturase isoform X1 [Aplysia californica]|uniref:Acyl-CoA (8-3)-desaturase isoform X1 n=1 Tax=Aplysia californica TaxID=6500 RepID=A0ABM0JCK3_APLCA|nr:acyl-CoA (8-3)-desaturase isoform X1 [Aplysia californica]XP_005090574.1 acyl-CoA (8-3)-desaturase isoform X1 [Aplysia californica]XP_005090575.1 acyl-CoA (8-3)-desaturase isoform X1 [Aplysia californica]XP_005090576.1 acyl-CoA (8-3)-desaturase isoform X1 [Aplysia californica]XP_005090578.1 acyl-CoA (8-3)-desaturase isoform X1 [Aplysia californica]
MGKGAQGEANGSVDVSRPLKEFTWDEVREKTTKECRWLVIDGEVYNITSWARRHPGGTKVIGHYAGQDATDAFKAFHNDLNFVKKYMKAIHIGTLKETQKEVKPIEEDFRQLRQTAEKMGLFKPSVLFFTLSMLHILFLDWAAWAVMYYFGTGWVPYLLSLIFITTVEAQVGYIQHDFGHLSVFKRSKWNHALHYFSLGFIKGASPAWWNHMHYQHHAKPNVMDKDPDVRLDALFVVGEHMPVEVAKNRKKSMPYNWQNYYFFLLGPPLLFPVYFQIMLFKFIYSRKAYLDLLMVIIFFIKFFYLFVPLLGVGGSLIYYFSFRCLESHWFTWVAQSNHIPMEINHDEGLPWLQLQLQATCNVSKSVFNDWFTGHLNFQIEHHLFPTMPRHNLYKIAPLVKSLCEKHNVSYVVKPLSTAFADIVRSLKHSGELWYSTYQAFHASSS